MEGRAFRNRGHVSMIKPDKSMVRSVLVNLTREIHTKVRVLPVPLFGMRIIHIFAVGKRCLHVCCNR